MARSMVAERPARVAPALGAALVASGIACAFLAGIGRRDAEAAHGGSGAGAKAAKEIERGRTADKPSDIPKPGWRDILVRVYQDLSANNVGLISAGVAFYALMALFPALTALVTIYGLFADRQNLQHMMDVMQGVLPAQAAEIIGDQLSALLKKPAAGLGIAGLVSLALTLWSARNGTASMITALNVVYEEKERRSFVQLALLSLGMTVGAIVMIIVGLFLIAALPMVIGFLPIGEAAKTIAQILRWPLLAGMAVLGLAALYRFGPSRDRPKWRWVTWGSAAATLLWLLASAGFSLYVSTIGSYDKTYGSLGGVIVLLMWLYITIYVVLLGAELNAEMEHQTARDTTRGTPQPIGMRRARMADELGEAHPGKARKKRREREGEEGMEQRTQA